MESILSIVATIISSVALVGVAAGLILQNRQLRANQIQIVREMHLELMKIGIDNPALSTSIYEGIPPEEFSRHSLLNFLMKFWETGYSLRTISRNSVLLQATGLFASENARAWWVLVRNAYQTEAGTRLEKEFFKIVDSAFNEAAQALQLANRSDINLSNGEV